MNIYLAAIAAVLVQPLVLIARLVPDYFASPGPYYGIGLMFLAVIAVAAAAAAVLLLGVPAFLLLQRFRRVSWVSLSLAGILIGGLPVALSWPQQLEGYSAGHNWNGKYIDTYINGVPTTYAWLTYGENVLFFSLHGLIGALVFYFVWRRCERPN